MGDIDHHIADADDRHVFAHVERTVAESRQAIKVVDDVLCVEHTFGRIAFDADGFRALRSD